MCSLRVSDGEFEKKRLLSAKIGSWSGCYPQIGVADTQFHHAAHQPNPLAVHRNRTPRWRSQGCCCRHNPCAYVCGIDHAASGFPHQLQRTTCCPCRDRGIFSVWWPIHASTHRITHTHAPLDTAEHSSTCVGPQETELENEATSRPTHLRSNEGFYFSATTCRAAFPSSSPAMQTNRIGEVTSNGLQGAAGCRRERERDARHPPIQKRLEAHLRFSGGFTSQRALSWTTAMRKGVPGALLQWWKGSSR